MAKEFAHFGQKSPHLEAASRFPGSSADCRTENFANLAGGTLPFGLMVFVLDDFQDFRLFAAQEYCPMRSFPFESCGLRPTNQRTVFFAWLRDFTFRLASYGWFDLRICVYHTWAYCLGVT